MICKLAPVVVWWGENIRRIPCVGKAKSYTQQKKISGAETSGKHYKTEWEENLRFFWGSNQKNGLVKYPKKNNKLD